MLDWALRGHRAHQAENWGKVCHLTIPNTLLALGSVARGVAEAAWKGFYAPMVREAGVKAGEGGERKEGPEPSCCGGKENRTDGLDLYTFPVTA